MHKALFLEEHILKLSNARFYLGTLCFMFLIVFSACSEKDDNRMTADGEMFDERSGFFQLGDETTPIFDEQAVFPLVAKPFKGDLAEIRERKFIRVLVNYSKTNFFF